MHSRGAFFVGRSAAFFYKNAQKGGSFDEPHTFGPGCPLDHRGLAAGPRGWHIKYINKSIGGILQNISEDGRVLHVSGGTAVMKDREGYRGISRDWIQGWGQGLALAFLSGVLNYDKMRSDGAL